MIWQDPILNFMPEVIKCSFTLRICILYQSTGNQQLVLCPSWRVHRGLNQASVVARDLHGAGPHGLFMSSSLFIPGGLWHVLAVDLGTVYFCQMFIQCSVVHYSAWCTWFISSGCLAVGTAHLSFIPTQQSPPTFHSWIPRNALVMASHSAVHCPRQARGRLPPSHTEASGSDLSDTGSVVPIPMPWLSSLPGTMWPQPWPGVRFTKICHEAGQSWITGPEIRHREVMPRWSGCLRTSDVSRAPCRRWQEMQWPWVRQVWGPSWSSCLHRGLWCIWKMSWISKISLFKFKFISIYCGKM